MSRAGRILVALALALLAVALVWLVAQRRPLATRALEAELRRRGFVEPRLAVTGLGPGGATLADVSLGREGELRAERIHLRWTGAELAAGRLSELRVEGLRLRARVGEPGLGLQLWAPARAADAAADDEAAGPPLGWLAALGSARLERAGLWLETPLGALEILADAQLAADRVLRIQARSEPARLRRGEGETFALPALHGAARLELGPRIGFELTLRDDARRAALRVEGDAAPDLAGGEARLRLEPLAFSAAGLAPGDLVPALADWLGEVEGGLAGRGRAVWGPGGLEGSADLAFENWRARLPFARVAGLNAALHLEGPPWPPAVPAPQLVSVARLDIGLQLDQGLVRFGLGRDGRLEIQDAEFGFAGGKLRTAGVLDLSASRQRLVLAIRGVDLGALLARVDLDGLSGEGRIDGELPLERRGESLRIRGGRLWSKGGGAIRYAPPGGVDALAGSQRGMDVLLGALRNFRYEQLRAELDGDTTGEVRIGLHLEGRNPDYQSGRPVEFNLDLQSRLVDLLRREAATLRVPEAILRRLGEIGAGAARPPALDSPRPAR